MAGIDKIYGTREQAAELKEWIEKHYPEWEKYLYDHNEMMQSADIIPISNFPTEADYRLYHECPLDFVKARIEDQYNGNGPTWEDVMEERKFREEIGWEPV